MKCNFCKRQMAICGTVVYCTTPDCPNHEPITMAQLWRGYTKTMELTELLRDVRKTNRKLIKQMRGKNER